MAHTQVTPQTQYVPWRPNPSVVKFFQDMSKRRVATPQGDNNMRITDTAPPKNSQYKAPKPGRGKQLSTASGSDQLVRTAMGQTHFTPTKSTSKKTTGKKKGGARKKTKTAGAKSKGVEKKLQKVRM